MKKNVKWIPVCAAVLAVVLFAAFCATHDLDMLLDVSRTAQPTQTTIPRETFDSVEVRDYSADDNVVRPVGRTLFHDGVRWFSMSGCGVEFSCVADWVEITLTVAQSYGVAYNHRPRVAVFVNGTMVEEETLDQESTVLRLDLSAAEGESIVKVIKLTESMYSCVGVSGIRVYADCSVIPTLQPDTLIEYIGDSSRRATGWMPKTVGAHSRRERKTIWRPMPI